MPTRIRSIGYLAEMMGSETTSAEAVAMRDLLIDADMLDWTHDTTGGTLYDISDADWDTYVAAAIADSN